jgi:ParB-like chromosome segregation protein Spo0J
VCANGRFGRFYGRLRYLALMTVRGLIRLINKKEARRPWREPGFLGSTTTEKENPVMTTYPTTKPIADITINQRHRKDLGDVEVLAASIKDIGLLHPVVITPDNVLIAGARRIAACKQLGWTEVPVRVVNLDEVVKGEYAENAHRKDFLPSEIDAIRRALEPEEKVAAKERMTLGKVCTGSTKTRDKIGEFAGVSGETVRKIAAVVKAAEKHPKKYAGIVDEMDRTGKVDKAYREIQRPTRDALGHPYDPGERTVKQPKTPPTPTDDQLLAMIEQALAGDATFQAKVEALPSWRTSSVTARPVADDDDEVAAIFQAAVDKDLPGDRPPPTPTPGPVQEMSAESIVPENVDDDFPQMPEFLRRKEEIRDGLLRRMPYLEHDPDRLEEMVLDRIR